MTTTVLAACASCQQSPCDCAAAYGRYGITSQTPGHPDSGRCAECTQLIGGELVHRGKFIYCPAHALAGIYTVPVLQVAGAVYLPGDVPEPGDWTLAPGAPWCPR